MTETENRVLKFCKDQVAMWTRQMELIDQGYMRTHTNHKDTTQETRAEIAQRHADLTQLIAHMEGREGA